MRLTVENDDTGSLVTARHRLNVGDLLQIDGESKIRRVTYVMGSDRNGWRACFKRQGALPVGTVTWETVEPHAPASSRVEVPALRRALSGQLDRPGPLPMRPVAGEVVAAPRPAMAAHTPGVALPGLHDGLAIFGFDSAWTRTNRGALCGVRYAAGHVECLAPRAVSFEAALDTIVHFSADASLRIVAIDQPLIVPNAAGNRPVEKAVSGSIGKRGGGVQPGNRSRIGMFSDDAPIWEFLKSLAPDLDPMEALTAKAGTFAIEVYPAAANITLFQNSGAVEPLLKYNPDRRTFNPADWQTLCERAAAAMQARGFAPLAHWCRDAARRLSPGKPDQDSLDSIISLLVGVHWRTKGTSASVVVGDLASGYMVIPADTTFAEELGCRLR